MLEANTIARGILIDGLDEIPVWPLVFTDQFGAPQRVVEGNEGATTQAVVIGEQRCLRAHAIIELVRGI